MSELYYYLTKLFGDKNTKNHEFSETPFQEKVIFSALKQVQPNGYIKKARIRDLTRTHYQELEKGMIMTIEIKWAWIKQRGYQRKQLFTLTLLRIRTLHEQAVQLGRKVSYLRRETNLHESIEESSRRNWIGSL